MTPIRKDALKRLGYIGLGIIPIIIVWEQGPPWSFLGLAGFLFSSFNLLFLLVLSQDLLDDFFPPKTFFEHESRTFDKVVYYFSMLLFFGGLVFEVFEIKKIDNTINGSKLFWQFAFIGILIAIIVTWLLKFISRTIYNEGARRYSIFFGLFIGFFLIVPAISSFFNRTYAGNTITCTTYDVLRKSVGGKRNHSFWLFLQINDKEERFDVTRNLYNSVNEGGQVQLCTRKGRLGYDYVERFQTVSSHAH